uniref:zinc finger CCCH-type with G patch domain-containing protein-like isoform X1 n=1 Tax=Ciona intestinalis TaxID=7719 RepID=UPI000180C5DB|nr:zinc finger CCCH-type with G patch domain-containing protein-like isoform X1 [Ciona intestinalis]|eukprot:XP_002128291.3 zinc finger CCCH-type with G patch domain-containing protein-like isoform X1 [Ciona intestinalis]
MDDMKTTLDTYRNQLSQINAAIESGQEDADLIVLRDDITNLISLTEESLLAYEKSQLMALLGNEDNQEQPSSSNQTPPPSDRIDEQLACFYADETSVSTDNKPELSLKISAGRSVLNEAFLSTIEDCDDISGVKCRAPYTTEWSGCHYHNAMIMNVVNDHQELEGKFPDDIIVKVLFLNPTMASMMSCPYYLEDKCRYSNDDCKYSHGCYVSLYTLHPFHQPDFNNFTPGSSCLAKQQDGTWGSATLDVVHEDLNYTVKFQHRNLTLNLGIDEILPTHHDNEDSESSDDDDDVIIVPGDVTITAKGIDSSTFGAWEQHTRGFGSKILMKLGYKMGEGLGTGGQGRVDPVQVEVLPVGKSLDHCMKIKEKRRAALDKNLKKVNPPNRHRPGMFNFLNKALGDKKKTPTKPKFQLQEAVKVKDLNNRTISRKMNQELVKNESKIKQVQSRVKKLKESVARNRERNPSVAKKLQVKLNEAMLELKSIKTENTAIEQQQKRAATHRKMAEF